MVLGHFAEPDARGLRRWRRRIGFGAIHVADAHTDSDSDSNADADADSDADADADTDANTHANTHADTDQHCAGAQGRCGEHHVANGQCELDGQRHR
jgi:hypothetical protein